MQEEGGEVRSRVAPGLGSCKKNCGVSSLFLAFEQEGVKREEGTGAGRKGEAREWIMKGKKKSFKFLCRGRESTAQSSKDESRPALCAEQTAAKFF